MEKSYTALVVNNNIDEGFSLNLLKMNHSPLQVGEVLIEVHYSGINYKDGLACLKDGQIVKSYPHIPGIDMAGIVIESKDKRYNIGDAVIATSYEIGVSQHGGFAERAVVNADWLIPLPQQLSLRDAMIVGTAGFTAALAIMRLQQNGLTQTDQPVAVTGATGGVGSHAILLLKQLGYNVVACTRKEDSKQYLAGLGADTIMLSDDLVSSKLRALDKQQWQAAIDVVGGNTLSHIIPKLQYGGSVAACGLTGGTAIESTVFPFILRGVNLLGIDSVYLPYEQRKQVWQFIANTSTSSQLNKLVYEEIELKEVPHAIEQVLQGKIKGRYLISLNK